MRMQLPREFFIPSGAVKVADKASDAVAYVYEDARGRPCARMFSGKKAKPDHCFYFVTQADRERRVRDFFQGRQRVAQVKAERKAEASKPHTLADGDILACSWGHEQTNVDFYQVVGVTKSSVYLRKIASEDVQNDCGYTGRCVAVKDAFIGETFSRRCNHTNYVSITSYAGAGKWDGQSRYWSRYS